MKIVLVSHSKDFSINTKEYLLDMIPNLNAGKIIPVGGDVDGGIGTDTQNIINAITSNHEDTLIICDLGSSILSAIAATTIVKNKTHISSGSFIEGSFAAATLMAAGISFKGVIKAAEETVFKK